MILHESHDLHDPLWIPLCESLGWLLSFPVASAENTWISSVSLGISFIQLSQRQSVIYSSESGKPCPNSWRSFSWSNPSVKDQQNYNGGSWKGIIFPLESHGTSLRDFHSIHRLQDFLWWRRTGYASWAAQVSVQDTTFYGIHILSPSQSSQAVWPWSRAVFQHQLTLKSAKSGLFPDRVSVGATLL